MSGTTRVSRYQKGKTNLDFTEARDSEWQWHQLGHMQVCTSLQTDNHASTPLLSFLQAGCPSCRPTNSVKALKALSLVNMKVLFLKNYLLLNFSMTLTSSVEHHLDNVNINRHARQLCRRWLVWKLSSEQTDKTNRLLNLDHKVVSNNKWQWRAWMV